MRSFSYWSVPHMHKGAWIMLPLLINKWNFTEGRTRHKVLLSHCVTPRWLKSGTDAMAHRKWGYAKKYLSNIKYLCLNPKRKACVMCCCFHCCSSLSAPSHLRKEKEPLALSPPSPKHPLPAAASKGCRKMKSWAAPVGLTINCSPHREMHLAIVITWPGGFCVFFPPPENVSHSATTHSDKVCTHAAGFLQKWLLLRTFLSGEAVTRLDLYATSDHPCM